MAVTHASRDVHPSPGASADVRGAVLVHGSLEHGVWRLTRAGVFVGEFRRADEALLVATGLAIEIERRGRAADVVFDAP